VSEIAPVAVVTAPQRPAVRRSWLRPERVKGLSLVAVLLATILLFNVVVDDYLSSRFVSRLLIAVSITALLAAGETLVIITRNIDLSVGATVGVSAYLTAELLADNRGLPAVAAVAFAVAIGAALGLVNGVLVAVARVPSIIVTLGTLSIFRSVLTSHAGGQTIATGSLPTWLIDLPRSTVFTIGDYEVRTMFALAVVIVVLLHLAMQYTRGGRHLYALGSNPEAARQAGLHDRRLEIAAFVACGALAGLAGFLYVGRFGTINVTAGSGLELAAIAAAVVGGVSTLGGSGTVMGAFLGAVLIALLDQSLVRVQQISEFWRDAILGTLILLAVVLDVSVGRRLRAAARTDALSEARPLGPQEIAPNTIGPNTLRNGVSDG
jgi:rhamnose transport system permease protein